MATTKEPAHEKPACCQLTRGVWNVSAQNMIYVCCGLGNGERLSNRAS